MAYLDLAGFKARTTMPGADVDRLEAAAPGWIAQKLASNSAEIDARLAKRFDVPFAAPYPETIKDWLERVTTPRAYMKRGVNPSDEQFQLLLADAEAAWKAIAETADSNIGLYELPLREDTTATGIARGTPQVSAQASPYAWTDVQRDAVSHNGGTTEPGWWPWR